MGMVVLLSVALIAFGGVIVNRAKSPPAANAGMLVASVGAVCLVISGLAWMIG